MGAELFFEPDEGIESIPIISTSIHKHAEASCFTRPLYVAVL